MTDLVLVWIDRQCQRIRRSLYVAFWFKAAWCSLLPPSCSNLEKQAVKYLLDFWRWWSPGLIVFLFKWNISCLVMRSRWVVQGKHTFLFTSISNSVDDLLFVNQFYFRFDFKFSVSQIPAQIIWEQLSFYLNGVQSFFFTSPDQTSPTSWYGLSWCHCVWPFQSARLWFHVHVKFSRKQLGWEIDLSLQKT